MGVMDFFCKRKFLKLHDFEMRISKSKVLENVSHLRGNIEIVAIDDQEFHPEINLRNSGFNIRSMRDINRVSDIEPFPIVLCDLNGVGASMSSETQGAYVIEEIKSHYPEKVVIAFTAASSGSKLAKRARAISDGYLKKDRPIEEWRELLDEKIKYISNPVEVWKSLRISLLNQGIELSELIEIEQIVLKNIGGDPAKTKTEIEGFLNSSDSDSSWKRGMLRFLNSDGFKLAFSLIIKNMAEN